SSRGRGRRELARRARRAVPVPRVRGRVESGRSLRRAAESRSAVRVRLLLAALVVACAFASPAHAYVNAQHARVQVALRALGLYCGPIDGLVGPQTLAAVRLAQRR